jgi:hypothetical protein
MGSAFDAWTSATMSAEAASCVINQAAPTVWISMPKFDAMAPSQIARNVGCLSGASAANVAGLETSSFMIGFR